MDIKKYRVWNRTLCIVREKKLDRVFDAPCDVYLDEENVVQPDILFVSEERTHIIGKTHIQGAPYLTVEILSESTAYTDHILI